MPDIKAPVVLGSVPFAFIEESRLTEHGGSIVESGSGYPIRLYVQSTQPLDPEEGDIWIKIG